MQQARDPDADERMRKIYQKYATKVATKHRELAKMIDRDTPEWDRLHASFHIQKAEGEHSRTEGVAVIMNDEQRRGLLEIKTDWDPSRISRALDALKSN